MSRKCFLLNKAKYYCKHADCLHLSDLEIKIES